MINYFCAGIRKLDHQGTELECPHTPLEYCSTNRWLIEKFSIENMPSIMRYETNALAIISKLGSALVSLFRFNDFKIIAFDFVLRKQSNSTTLTHVAGAHVFSRPSNLH